MGAGLGAARSKMSRLLALLKQRKGSRQPHNSDKAHGRTGDGRCGQTSRLCITTSGIKIDKLLGDLGGEEDSTDHTILPLL